MADRPPPALLAGLLAVAACAAPPAPPPAPPDPPLPARVTVHGDRTLQAALSELRPADGREVRVGGWSDPRAPLTLRLEDVPREVALEAVLRATGLIAVPRDGALVAGPWLAQQGGGDAPEASDPPHPAPLVDLAVAGITLAQVAVRIELATGRPVVVDPSLAGTPVTLTLWRCPADEALAVVARLARCELRPGPGRGWTLAPCAGVTLQFTGADVRALLQLLAAYAEVSLVVGPAVHGEVTVDLWAPDPLVALGELAAGLGLAAEQREGVVVVGKPPLRWGGPVTSPPGTGASSGR